MNTLIVIPSPIRTRGWSRGLVGVGGEQCHTGFLGSNGVFRVAASLPHP